MDEKLGFEKWGEPFMADPCTAFIRGQREKVGVYDDAMDFKVSNGIVGQWTGIPIHYCKCGGKPIVYEEGMAKRILNDDISDEIYFTDWDGYSIECENCGEVVSYCKTVESAITAWNNKMEV